MSETNTQTKVEFGDSDGDVPRMDELNSGAFVDDSVEIRPGDGRIATSDVKKSVIREFYKQGVAWENSKDDVYGNVEKYADSLETFKQNGADMRERFENAPEKEQAMLVAEAIAVTFASYRNPEGQLRDSYENTVESGTLSEFSNLVGRSPKGGQFRPRFNKFIKNNEHVELARVLAESGVSAAQQWAIDNISGIGPNKSGFPFLLLGFDVFVIDTNVRMILTSYVQKTAHFGHFPKCDTHETRGGSCCGAAYSDTNNDPRIDGPTGIGSWLKYGIWTKNRSYVAFHLRTHTNVQEVRQYGEVLQKNIKKNTGVDLSLRQLTQLMFNTGMKFTKSSYENNRANIFYGHKYFY